MVLIEKNNYKFYVDIEKTKEVLLRIVNKNDIIKPNLKKFQEQVKQDIVIYLVKDL